MRWERAVIYDVTYRCSSCRGAVTVFEDVNPADRFPKCPYCGEEVDISNCTCEPTDLDHQEGCPLLKEPKAEDLTPDYYSKWPMACKCCGADSEWSIACSKCGTISEEISKKREADKAFIAAGWGKVNGKWYCPKCLGEDEAIKDERKPVILGAGAYVDPEPVITPVMASLPPYVVYYCSFCGSTSVVRVAGFPKYQCNSCNSKLYG